MIPIVLVTGFLGSGKTTVLKHWAQRYRDRRFLYLVNDFASVDVDGELVRRAGPQVIALSGGSIFCHCLVTDFIRVLQQIAAGDTGLGAPPEAVIIEASGMADPRVIHRMLQETKLDAVFAVQRILALVDPGTFHKLLHTLPNIEAQVACADTILITKVDRHTADAVQATRAAALAIQPEASVRLVQNGETDEDLLATAPLPATTGDYAACVDPRFHRFTLTDPLPDLAGFRVKTAACGPRLYRAKGFLKEGQRTVAVDWSSSGLHTEECQGEPPPEPRLVCIADGPSGPDVERIWRSDTAACRPAGRAQPSQKLK